MEKVLLRRVQEYNPEIIRNIITEGMEELGIEKGARENITIKPNVVLAHHKLAPSAFTRPEFLDGLTGALKLNIGILLDRERMRNHNYKLDQVDTGMKILCGLPYCSGGCHGIFLDWLYMIKDRKPKHKDLLLSWLFRGRIINPLFRLDLIIDSYFFLFLSWCRRLLSGRL